VYQEAGPAPYFQDVERRARSNRRMLPGMGQLRVVVVVTLAQNSTRTRDIKRTGRITATDDFEVFERGEIRELGRKGRRDSREGQLSTGTRTSQSRL
jgi:hypothetical protein